MKFFEPLDIIFLDFDGVLHARSGIGRMFDKVPSLVPLFEENVRLRIVVSSDWRLGYGLAALTRKIGKPLSERVIGVTPSISLLRRMPAFRHSGSLFYREKEILWFLENARKLQYRFQNGYVRHWLAVDDNPEIFSPEFCKRNVFLTNPDTGIVEADIPLIFEKLVQERGR